MDDPFNLQRFVDAQAPVYDLALRELRAGHKTSHWMWFVFPQLKALGRSSTAKFYGLDSLEEAKAYWAHPLLGPRLKECTDAMLAVEGRDLHEILGSPDDLKFASTMTLFEAAVPGESVLAQAIEKYCDGNRDDATLRLLGS